jgi:hypothetical protein
MEDIIHASGKTGCVENILAAIIEKFHHHQERWTSLYKL